MITHTQMRYVNDAPAQPIAGAYAQDFSTPTATAVPRPTTIITKTRRRE
ncbi:hypothetical protein [Arthrobacter phoenicis]